MEIKYFKCPNCHSVITYEQILDEVGNGGTGLCNCGDINNKTLYEYKEVEKREYDSLKFMNEHKHKCEGCFKFIRHPREYKGKIYCFFCYMRNFHRIVDPLGLNAEMPNEIIGKKIKVTQGGQIYLPIVTDGLKVTLDIGGFKRVIDNNFLNSRRCYHIGTDLAGKEVTIVDFDNFPEDKITVVTNEVIQTFK